MDESSILGVIGIAFTMAIFFMVFWGVLNRGYADGGYGSGGGRETRLT